MALYSMGHWWLPQLNMREGGAGEQLALGPWCQGPAEVAGGLANRLGATKGLAEGSLGPEKVAVTQQESMMEGKHIW